MSLSTDGRISLTSANVLGTLNLGVSSSKIITDNSWHHVVAIRIDDPTGDWLKLYIDGSPENSQQFDQMATNTAWLEIGRVSSSSQSTRYFDGDIDEVNLYDEELSASNVLALFNEPGGGGATCSDGIQNGDEAGIDCGGSCPTTCPPGGTSLWTQSGDNIHYNSGNVGIGITNPPAKLTVNGAILGTQIKVKTDVSMFPDFVFDPDYPLMTISEVDNYIETHGHLPDIPTAQEAVTNGHDIGAMNLKLLQKIEELTLYAIEQECQIDELRTSNGELRMSNDDLKISNDEQKDALRNTQTALRKQEKAYSEMITAYGEITTRLIKLEKTNTKN